MLGFDGDAPGPEAIGDDAAEHERLLSVFADLSCAGAAELTTTRAIPPCAARSRTSTPISDCGIPRPRGCRTPSSSASRRCSSATASRVWTALLLWRRPATASSSPRSAREPCVLILRCSTACSSASAGAALRAALDQTRRHHRSSTRSFATSRARSASWLLRRAGHRRGARARLRRDGGARQGARRRARGPGREGQRVDALVACTRPARLAPVCCSAMATADPSRRVLLEVVARRFYRVRMLEGFAELDGRGPWAAGARPTGTRDAAAPRHRVRGRCRPRRRDERLRGLGRRRPRRRPARRRLLPARRRGHHRRTAARDPLHRRAARRRAPDRGRRRAGRRGPRHVAIGAFTFRPGPEGLARTRCSAACIR